MQGLANLGFTCAINSLVQIICRNDVLRNIILTYDDLHDNSLISNLRELIILMHIENKSIMPKKFVANIYNNFGNIFNYGEQIDITELWIFMNEKIISELNNNTKYHNSLLDFDNIEGKYKIINNISYDKYDDYIIALKNSKYLKEKYIYHYVTNCHNKISLWQNTTNGSLLNITKCKKCEHTLYNFELISSLHLNIPENIETPNIINMLQDFLEDNNYSNDWKCDNCNEKTEYIKSSKLWSLPNVLFIIINRFINPDIKNIKPININDALCFSKGTILSNTDIDKNYKLSSIALHTGNTGGGHYTSICSTKLNDENTFLLYNDDNISKPENFLHNNREAYMLVYNLS
jgi:ubiquitin C-terminal hydrolase